VLAIPSTPLPVPHISDVCTRQRIERQGRPHLSDERNRWLIKPNLLRIPYVRRYDLVEWQAVIVARLELYAVLLSSDGQFATHSILDVEESGVQSIDGEPTHAFSVAATEL
jgi:hypothetical protein